MASRQILQGQLTQTDVVQEFEIEVGREISSNSVVSCNSGTSALLLCLKSMGIGPGDDVIVPSFTFIATVNAVILAGARPILVDVEANYFCLNPDLVSQAITSKTRAIIPVHLFGQSADMEPIMKIAAEKGVVVIEDAAQAFGARYQNLPIGSLGHAAAFSFFPSKNVTTAEGGACWFRDPQHTKIARLLRNQGQNNTYEYLIPGYNFRLSSVHASIGLGQLRQIKRTNEVRVRNAMVYKSMLPSETIPKERPDSLHSFNQFVIRVPAASRRDLIQRLDRRGIPTRIYYPRSLSEISFLKDYPKVEDGTSATLAEELLALPIFPNLTQRKFRVLAKDISTEVARCLA